MVQSRWSWRLCSMCFKTISWRNSAFAFVRVLDPTYLPAKSKAYPFHKFMKGAGMAQTDIPYIPYSQHAAHPAHHTRQPETKRRQRSTHFEYLRTSFFLSCNLCTLKLCSSFQSRLFDLAWEVCVIWLRCLSLSAQCKQHNWDLWLQLKRNLLSSSVHFPRLSYLLPPLLNLGVVGKVFDCMLACFHETATDFPHHLFALLGFKFGRTKLRLWHRASCKSQAGRHLQTKLGAAEPGPKSRLSVHSL